MHIAVLRKDRRNLVFILAAAHRQRSVPKIYHDTEVETVDSRKQAGRIYEFCIANLKTKKKFLTYGEVLKALGYKKGVSGQAIRFGLELVLIACAENRLPILTSIVVNQLTGSPSAGEYPEKSWEKEAQRVFSHEKWPDVDEIDWNYIWANRKKLSERFGTPGYWGN